MESNVKQKAKTYLEFRKEVWDEKSRCRDLHHIGSIYESLLLRLIPPSKYREEVLERNHN